MLGLPRDGFGNNSAINNTTVSLQLFGTFNILCEQLFISSSCDPMHLFSYVLLFSNDNENMLMS